MTFSPDIADDLDSVDAVETLTLYGTSEVSVADCVRGGLSRKELAFGAQMGISPNDIPFLLPANNLTGVKPAAQDELKDAADLRYIITSAVLDPLGAVYRVVTCPKRTA